MIHGMTSETQFAEVIELIKKSREQAYKAVNTTLIELYWEIGQTISRKIALSEWGEGIVEQLASYISKTQPGIRGFTRSNLFRMRQFYEAYCSDAIVSPLVRQLPWTHNLIILSQSKRPEEREFYIRMAIREQWSKRELEHQFKTALFERSVLHPPKVSSTVAQTHPNALNVFKDIYILDFLNLPDNHQESDLHNALLQQLKKFGSIENQVSYVDPIS